MLSKIMDDPFGRIVISVLLGFGLATIFRQVCKGNSCVVINGPSPSEVQKHYYKIDQDCYKYTPYSVTCDSDNNKA